jgi:hypothetical protein
MTYTILAICDRIRDINIMAENRLKFGNTSLEHDSGSANLSKLQQTDVVIEGAVSEISEKLDTFGENSEESGKFKENSGGVKDYAFKDGKQSNPPKDNSKRVLPAIETMIQQTVEAVELQLKFEEKEFKKLLREKQASPYLLNEKIKQIRVLDNLRLKLKKAVKLAEDYVIGLWKQYVKKVG